MGSQLKQQGLTLIEVMVAIFILSLVMVGVILSSSQVLRSTVRLHDRVLALWVVEAVAVDLMSGVLGKVSAHSNFTGEQDMGKKTWHWVAKAEPFHDIIRVDIGIIEDGGTETVLSKPYYLSPQ